MEFGIEKCAMLTMKWVKREIMKEIEQPSQESIKTPGKKKNSKYLGILEADTLKQADIKEKINKKRVLQKNEKTSRNQFRLENQT